MKWVEKPSADHILYVAERLRDADVQEVMLSHGSSALEAVTESWAQSTLVKGMVTDDDEPCGLCGPPSLHALSGWIWAESQLLCAESQT